MRLTFFMRLIPRRRGTPFPNLLQTDICLFEVSSISSAKPENQYSSQRLGFPNRQIRIGFKPGSVPRLRFKHLKAARARAALLSAVGNARFILTDHRLNLPTGPTPRALASRTINVFHTRLQWKRCSTEKMALLYQLLVSLANIYFRSPVQKPLCAEGR